MIPAATPEAAMPPARNAPRIAFLVVGAAFTVIAIAYGVMVVISLLSYQSTTERATYAGEIRRVVLDVSGDVRITGVDAEETTVERRLRWSLNRPKVTESVDGETLTIRARCGFSFAIGCGSDLLIRVPRQADIDADSSASDIVVTGLSGDVVLESSAGDVEVHGLSGRLTLSSSAGDVRGTGLLSADVDAKSSAGDVELFFDSAPLAVAANSSAGDVHLALPRGTAAYRVQADSSAGRVVTDVLTDPRSNRTLNLRSSAGDVIVIYGR
jgi:hypothetical protein